MTFVLRFDQVSASDGATVGGKGANLGELTRAGFCVPSGLCVTTAAFDAFLAGCPGLDALYIRLDSVDGKDAAAAKTVAEAMRSELIASPMPAAVEREVLAAWQLLGADGTWAVRSSATAEDLPGASFAGQQDTYLNIKGQAALLDAIRRCWVSLFTDRAVLYRARNGFGHREVKLSVVIQSMVLPEVSGIMFTADPITGRRSTLSIEAGFGLGEALVGGLVSGDLYRVDKKTMTQIEMRIGDKALAIRPLPEGGTFEEKLSEQQRAERVLDDAAIQSLSALGVKIEKHYGLPQDIEWCLERGKLFVVQSRPITSLFPLPAPAPRDDGLHAYISFGHVQMMTNPMPPLAVEVFQLLLPLDRDPRTGLSGGVATAASRIYLDLTPLARRRATRRGIVKVLGRVYPDIGQGLDVLTGSAEFKRGAGQGAVRLSVIASLIVPVVLQVLRRLLFSNPERVRVATDALAERMMAQAHAKLSTAPLGRARLTAVKEVLSPFFKKAFLVTATSIPAGLIAKEVLAALVRAGRLGGNADDLAALERGLPGNITTEMDLAVGDLTDQARNQPKLTELLQSLAPLEALTAISEAPEGAAFTAAWAKFIQRFGSRGPGEVDISRPRFSEDPSALVSTLLGGFRTQRAAGHHRAHHAALAAEANAAAARMVAAARNWVEVAVARRLIKVARTGLALREHPKYMLIRLFEAVRMAILPVGDALVEQGALARRDDVFLFHFDELASAFGVAGVSLKDEALKRRAVIERDAKRAAPYVISSDGEIPVLPLREGLPPGAMSGTAASPGVVEGLARVIHDPGKEVLHDGEILVAPHTDPGWTPLFVHAAAVNTEVGGLITHGSVVAREYGIPAVVSIANATTKIKTGQRLRVDGTRGIVEILEEPKAAAS